MVKGYSKPIDKVQMIHKFNKAQKADPTLSKSKFCLEQKPPVSYTTYLGWETNPNILSIMKFLNNQTYETEKQFEQIISELLVEKEVENLSTKMVYMQIIGLTKEQFESKGLVMVEERQTEKKTIKILRQKLDVTLDENKRNKQSLDRQQSRLDRQKRTIKAMKSSIQILKSRNRKKMDRKRKNIRAKTIKVIPLCEDPFNQIKINTYTNKNIEMGEGLLEFGDNKHAAWYMACGLAYMPDGMYRATVDALAQRLPEHIIKMVEECGEVARQRAKRQKLEILQQHTREIKERDLASDKSVKDEDGPHDRPIDFVRNDGDTIEVNNGFNSDSTWKQPLSPQISKNGQFTASGSATAAAPVEEKVEESAAPVEEKVEESAAPVVEESAAPVEESAAPVEETPAPVEEKVEETAAQVEQKVEESGPVEESAALVVEEAAAAAPVVEEAAAPVVEEEKVAEPVVEEAKVEEAAASVVEEEKTAEPVVEEAKVEEAKVEEAKVEEAAAAPVVEEAKVEEANVEEAKVKETAAPAVEEEKAAEPVAEEKKEEAAPVEEKKEEAVVEAENEEAKPATEKPANETTTEAPKTEDKQSESQAAN